jgi:hypothetical protein
VERIFGEWLFLAGNVYLAMMQKWSLNSVAYMMVSQEIQSS